MGTLFRSPTGFLLAGLAYLTIGFVSLWMYVFVMLPLVAARTVFEATKAEHDIVVSLRDTFRPLLTSGGDGKLSPASDAFLKALQPFLPSLPLERARLFLAPETDFERLQKRADANYAQHWEHLHKSGAPSSPPPPTDANSAALPSKQAAPQPTPPSYLFLAWLSETNEGLNSTWLARCHASSPVAEITIKAFLMLGLSLGLVLGSWRLLKLSRATSQEIRDPKYYLLPLVVPVIALLAVLLLTGFGPVFSGPVDPATNRFLMIMTAIIALAPDQFILALRNYLVDTFKTLSSSGSGENTPG